MKKSEGKRSFLPLCYSPRLWNLGSPPQWRVSLEASSASQKLWISGLLLPTTNQPKPSWSYSIQHWIHPLPAWPCHTQAPVATISLMITVVSSIYLPQKLVLHRAAQGVSLGHIFGFLLWLSVWRRENSPWPEPQLEHPGPCHLPAPGLTCARAFSMPFPSLGVPPFSVNSFQPCTSQLKHQLISTP